MKPGGFVVGASIASAVAFFGACAVALAQFSIVLEAATR
jgi:hypothetical protein